MDLNAYNVKGGDGVRREKETGREVLIDIRKMQ